jgi:hypothetical protein
MVGVFAPWLLEDMTNKDIENLPPKELVLNVYPYTTGLKVGQLVNVGSFPLPF